MRRPDDSALLIVARGSTVNPNSSAPTLAHAAEREKKLIMQALATTNGNVTAAAKKLGISRRTLHRKINEMNLAKTSTEDTGKL